MLALLFSLRDCFRARAVLQAEILALRHQLLVLQRSSRGHRLCLGCADRVLWVWLSRLWNDWRSALLLVKPQTVIAWQRKGFRLYWNWKSRPIPIQSKPLALPGDDSLRLDKEQCRTPIVPQSRKPDPQDTVSATETQPMPTARTLQDQKLMPECKNLCLQNSASSETIS